MAKLLKTFENTDQKIISHSRIRELREKCLATFSDKMSTGQASSNDGLGFAYVSAAQRMHDFDLRLWLC